MAAKDRKERKDSGGRTAPSAARALVRSLSEFPSPASVQGTAGEAARAPVWLRVALLSACLLTMLASAPVWLAIRLYPTLPVADWFPVPGPPVDKLAFAAVLGSLVAAVWAYRPAVMCFLAGSLMLALGDQ